jgi:hypothetical protein
MTRLPLNVMEGKQLPTLSQANMKGRYFQSPAVEVFFIARISFFFFFIIIFVKKKFSICQVILYCANLQTITSHADGNQNLDLNLGIAPPVTSDSLKVNSNMGGFYFQGGWDGVSTDRAPKVPLKSMWIFLRPKWYSVFVLESFDYLSTIYLMS